ncbi:hypothetical protein M0802_004929 [Mischocyttarus mexicanus]|nr:hypothetical protein M0802_004929 [Mischocyttarus mexicanus]
MKNSRVCGRVEGEREGGRGSVVVVVVMVVMVMVVVVEEASLLAIVMRSQRNAFPPGSTSYHHHHSNHHHQPPPPTTTTTITTTTTTTTINNTFSFSTSFSFFRRLCNSNSSNSSSSSSWLLFLSGRPFTIGNLHKRLTEAKLNHTREKNRKATEVFLRGGAEGALDEQNGTHDSQGAPRTGDEDGARFRPLPGPLKNFPNNVLTKSFVVRINLVQCSTECVGISVTTFVMVMVVVVVACGSGQSGPGTDTVVPRPYTKRSIEESTRDGLVTSEFLSPSNSRTLRIDERVSVFKENEEQQQLKEEEAEDEEEEQPEQP